MSLPMSFVTSLTELRSSTQAHDVLGSICFVGSKVYKYVYFKTSPSADVDDVAGDMVVYSDYSAHEVTTDYTDIDTGEEAAGILTQTVDMSADSGKFTWIQIKGYAILGQTVANSAAATQRIGATGTGADDLTFTLGITLLSSCGTLINATTKEVSLDCTF